MARQDRIVPEDIDRVQFTSHRFLSHPGKYGYDETEVDEFLDAVAEQISEDMREIDQLRSELERIKNV